MAIVKIKFAKHLQKLVRYVMDAKDPSVPVQTHDCNEESIAADFSLIRNFEKGKGSIDAIHIVQSWSEKESKMFSPAEFNTMGKELTEAKFPGHAFAVVTHTDTDKIHNHIIVSPWHGETGKKIENKKYHLYELRSINDTLSKARGLSIINGDAKERQARLPDKVQKIAQFRGKSWVFDICQKADFARAYATSFDQYVGILHELGVKARVEEKNITYFYSEKVRGKRGDKLGRSYDKAGLEKAFRSNDERFAKIPGLRNQIGQQDLARQFKPKDYSQFTKVDRPGRAQRFPHELDLANSIIPIEELRRARNSNIIQYCRANKIALEKNSEGRTVLTGRTFVEIGDHEWVNKRNRTKGSLIELVAAHKNMTFVQAVAEINGNKRLLLLEAQVGEVKRPYTSFHIPKEHRLQELGAKVKVAHLLTTFGAAPEHAASLFKSGQAHVSKEGVIRLFGKDDDRGAWEFVENDRGQWNRTKVGEFTKLFFAVNSGNKKATVYVDPFSFLRANGKHALWAGKHDQNVVCLMEPDHKILDQYLATNRHLKELAIFQAHDHVGSQPPIDFFNTLKAKYAPLGITVGHCHQHERVRERGHDLPSL